MVRHHRSAWLAVERAGIGQLLMPELLDRARAQGAHDPAGGDINYIFGSRPRAGRTSARRRETTEIRRIAPARRAHTMIGVVDASNQASMAFHETLGFELLWLLPETGRKFDRWLTAAFWVLRL